MSPLGHQRKFMWAEPGGAASFGASQDVVPSWAGSELRFCPMEEPAPF